MIKFDKVTKIFKPNITALKDFDFHVKKGEFVFLVGASGAGKTTVLRLLLGTIKPDEGSITVDGEQIEKLKSGKIHLYRRKIGAVFQDYKLLSNLKVAENVSVAGKLTKMKSDEVSKRTKEVLKTVELEDKQDFFPVQLSGGELQRLALARALVNQPEIIFADEPTGNLDPKYAWQIMSLLKKINKTGITIIMSSHNVDIVDSMKERVVTLAKGKIVSDKKTSKYYS